MITHVDDISKMLWPPNEAHCDLRIIIFLADGESGMEEESRSVSGFLHFDTVSKGWCHLSTHFNSVIIIG